MIATPATLSRLLADPRLAIGEEHIVCLVCGAGYRQLTNTHLGSHDTTSAAYKARFGYNRRRPLMCGALRRRYAERAVQSRLAARIARRPIVTDPDLRKLGGRRPIALEEMLNRHDAQRKGKRLRITPP